MKKVLATLLALVLVLGMIPMAGLVAFAEDDGLQLKNPDLPNSRSNPYLIGTVDEWLKFCETASALTENAFYALSADIDFKDHNTEGYMADGDKNMDCVYADTFYGEFDGNGYALKNLDIKSKTAAATGLFKNFYGTRLSNLVLDNVDITTEFTGEHAQYIGMLIGLSRPAAGDGTGALVEGFEQEVMENIVITDTCSITDLSPVSAPRIGFIAGSMSRSGSRESRAMTFRNMYIGGTVTTQGNQPSGSQYYGALFGDCSSFKSGSQGVSVKLRVENVATNVTFNHNLYKKTGNWAMGGLIGETVPNELEIRNCYVNTTVNMNYGEATLDYLKGTEAKQATFDKTVDILTTGGVGGIVGTLGRPVNYFSQFARKDYIIEDCVVNMTLGGTLYADTTSDVIPYTGAIVGLLGNKANQGWLISNVIVEDVTYAINSTKYQKYGNSRTDLAYPTDLTPDFTPGATNPTDIVYCTVKETAGTVKLAQAQVVKTQIALGAVKIAPVVTIKDVAAIKLDTATNIKFWAEASAAAADFYKTTFNATVTETGVAILKKADFDAADRNVSAVDASKVKLAKVGEAVTDTIAAADYGTEYVAVGYAKVTYNGTSYTVYYAGSTTAKSVAGIATLALADTCVAYTDAQKAALTAFAPAAN